MTEVSFVAVIRLDEGWEEAADGDVAQAVQNEIGHTGAQVVEAEIIGERRRDDD